MQIGHPGASEHVGTLPPHSLRSISESSPIEPQLLLEVRYLSKLVSKELFVVTESKAGEDSNKSKSAFTLDGIIMNDDINKQNFAIFMVFF